MQAVIEAAPKLVEHLDEDSRRHFEELCGLLDAMGIAYRLNPRLVRGLDYYSKTVFEWVTDRLGAQGTVCAGGRFDGLIEQLGARPTPAMGFALGLERLVALLEDKSLPDMSSRHAYLLLAGREAEQQGRVLAEQLRDTLPQLRLVVNSGGGSFKSQMKRADKSGAHLALILGENEINNQQISIKNLRQDQEQEVIALTALPEFLSATLQIQN